MRRSYKNANKWVALCAVIMMVMVMAGCSCGQGSGEESSGAGNIGGDEVGNEGTSAGAIGGGTLDPTYVPGTYTGSAQGYGGIIEVTVEVDEMSILSIEAVGEQETPNVGQIALAELPDQIVQANSTNIDGMSGATYSSQGLFEAVNDALAQAYTNE